MYNNYGSGNAIAYLIIGLIVVVGIFLLLREFWCWYWKINKINSQIAEQNQLLKQLLIHFGVSGISIEESPKSVEEQIPSIKNDEDVQQNELKIIRLKRIVGSSVLVDVKIDNEISISLEDGGQKIVKIANGKHTITAISDNDIVRKDFEINNDGKIFSIIIEPPLKINEV
jgi:hypothetical protein